MREDRDVNDGGEEQVLRIGLCGLGDAGQLHARALKAGGERIAWVAIAGRDRKGAERFGEREKLGAEIGRFGSLEEMLGGCELDAVILATPDGVHVPQALRALIAGAHVLVEKPLALRAAEASAVVNTARSAGLVVRAGYHLRHHAAHRWMKEQIAERCGRVHHVEASWAWPDPAVHGWRAKGEGARSWSLSALGTHCLDLITWMTGATVERVAAVVERGETGGVDVAAAVSMQLGGGALAQMACSVKHRALSRLIVAGELGELSALGTFGAHGGGQLRYRSARERGHVEEIAFPVENPYLNQLRAFAEAVAQGGGPEAPSDTSPGASPDASLVANVALLDQILASARGEREHD